jgi:ketosteroid isomerase-like protein
MTPENLMRSVVAAFEKGDLVPLVAAADPNIVWKSGSTRKGPFRFGGTYQRTPGLVEVLSEISSRYTFRRFEPREIVSSGEVVFGLFDVEIEYRGAGDWPVLQSKPIVTEFVLRWRVRDDKILEHQAFFDTASMLMQQS